MSDFLSELVTRGRGLGIELVPRIPSLFESTPGPVFGTGSEEPDERVEPARHDAPAVSGPHRPVDESMPPPRPAPPPDPQAAAPASRAAASRAAAEEGRRVVVETAAPMRSRADAGDRAGALRVPAGQADPRTPPPRAATEGAPPGPAVRDDRPGDARPEPSGARDPGTGTDSSSTPRRQEPAYRPERSAPPRVEVVATRRDSASPRGDEPGAPAEPTVHVTIGRVEIRAVAAPTPAVRRGEPQRATSLDDYLAQRNRRRRR